jgi:LPS export ABC transporter protein LptC
MTKWQKRARWGLASFGIVFAIVVYAAIGERQSAAPGAIPSRLDPRAILESAGAAFQQFQAARQDYVIEADRQLTYEGGATKFIGVTIKVRQREGRDFIVSGREAQADENQKDLKITGDVKLSASDGFVATTDEATFNQDDATMRIAGPVSFQKERMSGSGVGMTYNQMTDVLSLAAQARVVVTDESGKAVNEFTSDAATLARVENYLQLNGNVHALRGEQVLDADNGRALLSDDDNRITFIELRGNARVSGGAVVESMTARDIDLDYADDGTLERVTLAGSGVIAMAGGEGESGRRFAGDLLELAFAPDASLTRAIGRGNVRVDLPGAPGTPARSVRAREFEATGEPGKDLTSARFENDVEYREEGAAGRPARVARSTVLRLSLAGQAVTGATFAGSVKFEEQGLQASAAEAQYDPSAGTLRLSGTDAGGSPRVADAQIEIDAQAIDVTLQGRNMSARGNVQTVLRTAAAPAAGAARLPGLLQQGQPANVSGNTLEYQGAARKAVYTGNAVLWQGETAIRADTITLDQARGDLLASGNARSNLMLENGTSIGRARDIRYDDATRTVTYVSPPPPAPVTPAPVTAATPTPAPVTPAPVTPAPAAPAASVAPTTVAPGTAAPIAPAAVAPLPSQLSGPQGDLRATRLEVVLAKTGSRAERLEAYGAVVMRLDTRVATGDRLTYFADEERYVVTGIPTVPVLIVEDCRETRGRTVTFFKATERIIVDGNEEVRTQSKRGGGPCPAAPRAR